MWFIVGLFAFLIAAAAGGFGVGLFVAVVAGGLTFVLRLLWRKSRQQSTLEFQEQDRAQNELMARVDKLESRVRELERQIASAMDIKPAARVMPAANPAAASTSSAASISAAEQPIFVPETNKVPETTTGQSSSVHFSAALAKQAVANVTSNQQEHIAPSAVPQFIRATPPAPQAKSHQVPQAPTPTKYPIPPKAPEKTLRERMPDWAVKLIFGGNSLVKVGVLILFLGLAFLLRYTADRVTVPVEFRYVGVLFAGMVLLVIGWLLRDKRRDYAHILQGSGIAVLYLTILGAMKLHQLIPVGVGFAALAFVAVIAAALAVLQDALALALLAALGGFAAPILVSTGGSRPAPLLLYMAFLDIGILLMAWFKSWRVLNIVGFTATFALASGWASRNYQSTDDTVLHIGVVFFFLLFTAVATLFARRSLIDVPMDDRASLGQRALSSLKAVGRVDSALVFGLPIAAFGLEYQLTKAFEFVPAFVAIGFALFYLTLAKLVLSRDSRGLRLLAEAFAVVGVIFATLSIPLGLEGLWTGAAWAVEGAGMYWLGLRQNRPYARVFAFVVMAGAAWKLLQDTAIAQAPEISFLTGSNIGPLLLAASAVVMIWLNRKWQGTSMDPLLAATSTAESSTPPLKAASALAPWEVTAGKFLPWLAAYSFVLLPWQWWSPGTAAAATAVFATGVFVLGRKLQVAAVHALVTSLQALAVLGFVSTLHLSQNVSSQAMLSNGWQGAWPALVIAASLILTTAWRMLAVRIVALANKTAPNWSLASSVGVTVIVLLLCAASLFGLNLRQVAWAWPLASLLLLGFGLRLAHNGLAALAASLQIVGGLIYLIFHLELRLDFSAGAYLNSAFATELALGAVGLLSAWLTWRESKHVWAGKQWVSAWTISTLAQYLPLAWGLLWWMTAWLSETARYTLSAQGPGPGYLPTLTLLVILLSSALLATVATWRNWLQAGRFSSLTLVGIVLCYWEGLYATLSSGVFFATNFGGAILWPVALVWHFALLRLQAKWLPVQHLKALHVVGFWFFLWLFAKESQTLADHYLLEPSSTSSAVGAAGTSWSWLAAMIIPVLVFTALRSSWLSRRWPLTAFAEAYRMIASAPVAIYLFGWVLLSNVLSSGNAAPLPYLPVLNPLEMGQWLVLASLLLWGRDLSQVTVAGQSPLKPILLPAAAVTALILITGTVVRTCYHYAGAQWGIEGVMQSTVTQAALSVTWAVCAVAAMSLSNRLRMRAVWVAGAALMGVVVLKLLLVDLSDSGGIYRIVSFIGVGILLLLVGYFAPVPPKQNPIPDSH